jgi:competence protein ComEC
MRPAAKSNAMSCVLRVADAQGRNLLLTGTSKPSRSAPEWRTLRLAAGAGGPHHGGRTSSTPARSRRGIAVSGRYGYRNRFGHPGATVMSRYAERGISVARSDGCGAWQWSSADSTAAAHCERERAARYWHHRWMQE